MKEGWNTSELKDICSKYGEYGMSVPSKPFDGIRYLRITDITDNGSLNPELVSAEIENIDDSYRLEIGDVLFARTGATVGKTLVYEESMGPCVYAGYLIRYKPDQSIILPRFLYYITHSNKYYQWVNKNQKVAAQPNISAKLYNSYKVSYPSLHEQQQMVDFLDAEFAKIDELKNQAEQSLQNAKDLFQAALKEMLTPKEGWKTSTLKDECYKITDGTHQTPKYFSSGYIFLSSKNVTQRRIDWDNVKYIDNKQHEEMHKRVSPQVGDILLAKNGTTGVAAMVDRDVVFDIYVSLALLRTKGNVDAEYMLSYINSPMAKEQFDKRLIGMGVPNLHLGEINQVTIQYPIDKNEQIKITKKIHELDSNIQQLQSNYTRTIQLCADLKQALLRQVFE